MHQKVLFILLLAGLLRPIQTLTPADLSSPFLLQPGNHESNCAINFGKDITSGPFHSPELVFYDGIRCERQFSENETTVFTVGKSRSLSDVGEAAKHVGDVLALRAQMLGGTGRRSRNASVKCGMRSLKEVLFLRATTNGTVKARRRRFHVREKGFYAFVDDADTGRNGLVGEQNGTLCLFKGEIRVDEFVDSAGVESTSIREGVGIIVAWVFGLAFIVIIVRYLLCYLSDFD